MEWGNGNKAALDLLMPIVYDELHKLAASYLRREHNARTLQPTAIIHEAYVRLVEQDLSDLNSRSHFFGVAAHLMRQILIDHARKHQTAKRGAGSEKLPLDEATYFAPERSSELIGLDDALKSLKERIHARQKSSSYGFSGDYRSKRPQRSSAFPSQRLGGAALCRSVAAHGDGEQQ